MYKTHVLCHLHHISKPLVPPRRYDGPAAPLRGSLSVTRYQSSLLTMTYEQYAAVAQARGGGGAVVEPAW